MENDWGLLHGAPEDGNVGFLGLRSVSTASVNLALEMENVSDRVSDPSGTVFACHLLLADGLDGQSDCCIADWA